MQKWELQKTSFASLNLIIALNHWSIENSNVILHLFAYSKEYLNHPLTEIKFAVQTFLSTKGTFLIEIWHCSHWYFMPAKNKCDFNFHKVLTNEDKLLRTHCCWHKCFPLCAQHLLRTQILCPGHKNVSDFVQKHFVSTTNVSQFAQPKEHYGQQCIRNNVSSFTRAYSLAPLADKFAWNVND